jgi:hypothetical protein
LPWFDPLPPPQEQITISRRKGNRWSHGEADRFLSRPGTTSHPKTATAQNHCRLRYNVALVRDVVVTVTVRGVVEVALTFMLPGTEQLAP